jgi:dimethylargininase
MYSRAIVRPPGTNYADGLTSVALGAPNHARALQQHAAYCEALERCGLTLFRLDADQDYPDSTFVEDTAVMLRSRVGAGSPPAPDASGVIAILTRPGAASRAGEVERIKPTISSFCAGVFQIQQPGTLDGGDICEADDHFFIGISARTNDIGAEQLARIVRSFGYSSSFIDIRNEQSILHLKSGLAYLDGNRLVVINALAKRDEFRDYDLVNVNPDEEYAANCVRVNDYVLVASGFPGFEQTLRKLGYQTLTLEMTEFQKMDGGLSCLSLRF